MPLPPANLPRFCTSFQTPPSLSDTPDSIPLYMMDSPFPTMPDQDRLPATSHHLKSFPSCSALLGFHLLLLTPSLSLRFTRAHQATHKVLCKSPHDSETKVSSLTTNIHLKALPLPAPVFPRFSELLLGVVVGTNPSGCLAGTFQSPYNVKRPSLDAAPYVPLCQCLFPALDPFLHFGIHQTPHSCPLGTLQVPSMM